jgi:DNA-binding Lrp family transcriptional regulator
MLPDDAASLQALPPRRLDPTDLALVDLLLEDARMPLRVVAERLGIAPLTARQRLERLRESGAVRIVGLVDPAVLGRPVVAFLVVHVNGDAYEIAETLRSLEDVQWMAVAADLRTLLLQASLASNVDLLDLIDDQIRAVPGVQAVAADLGLRSYATTFRFGRELPAGTEDAPTAPWLAGHDARSVDPIDVALLTALQLDGRLTFAHLSRQVGLSVPATRQRYLRLVEDGLLRIQCRPDLPSLGLDVAATIRIEVSSGAQALAGRLADLSEAVWVTETTGASNICSEIVCRDLRHLAATVDAIQGMPEVRAVDVTVHRSVVKSTARWS